MPKFNQKSQLISSSQPNLSIACCPLTKHIWCHNPAPSLLPHRTISSQTGTIQKHSVSIDKHSGVASGIVVRFHTLVATRLVSESRLQRDTLGARRRRWAPLETCKKTRDRWLQRRGENCEMKDICSRNQSCISESASEERSCFTQTPQWCF